MFKRSMLSMACLLSVSFNGLANADLDIGFEAYYGYGFSLKYEMNESLTAQGILSPYAIGARGIYSLGKVKENKTLAKFNVEKYAYGSLGMFHIQGVDSVSLIGGGVGFSGEFGHTFAGNDDFPLTWSMDIGYLMADSYYGGIDLSFGVHYTLEDALK